KLKAVFSNDDQKLWPGQFVSTRVVVDTLLDARVVPTTAIRRGPNGTFVYVIGEDERALVRPVNVVLQDEMRAVIVGVEVGSEVVTVGFAQLADNKPVKIVAGGQPAPSATETSKPERKWQGSGKRDEPGAHERRHRRDKGAAEGPAPAKGDTREAAK